MKSAALIFNPRAGAWGATDLVERIRRELEGGNYRVELLGTDHPGHASELAADAAARGIEAVLAFGGDGTLREAAAGLLGAETSVAPIPGGTTNVVAGAFGLPQNPLTAAAALGSPLGSPHFAVLAPLFVLLPKRLGTWHAPAAVFAVSLLLTLAVTSSAWTPL